MQVQAEGVDCAAHVHAVGAGHDDAILLVGVFFDGDNFNVEVAVNGDVESGYGENEVGVAGHEVAAQIWGDVDDGFMAGRIVGRVFFAAAHEECGGKCD